jgi:hypothetical protein
MAELVPLTSISIPDLVGFTRSEMTSEIVEKIKSHPEWNEIWDGELLQNSSYAIINFFSYLLSKTKEANNRLVKENFFVAADDPKSIANGLLAYGLSLPQARGAKVRVQGIVGGNDYIFKQLVIAPGTKLSGIGTEGDSVEFEIYNTIGDNYVIDYDSNIVIEPDNTGAQKKNFFVTAFAGTTSSETFELPNYDYEKFTINLDVSEVIQDSIEVIFDLGGMKQTKLLEVSNFTSTKSYNNVFTLNNSTGIPMYKVTYTDAGSAKIIFGTKTFGGYFPASVINSSDYKTITVRYRTGGGKTTNINRFGINQTLFLNITPTKTIEVLFRNLDLGSGGRDIGSIFEEQYYAPMRFGKDKAIVDERDVLNELSGTLVKHKVVSPKYSDDPKVNILHYNNYIVPYRSLETFSFPTPLTNETREAYDVRWREALNEFCNVDKIHDGLIENELVRGFVTTNFNYTLQMSNPLNGSVTLYAFDEDGNEKDRLRFPNNYSGSTNSSAGTTIPAKVVSTFAIGAVTVPIGVNKLKICLDCESGISGSELDVVISIQDGVTYGTDTDGKATTLAQAINSAIHASGNSYIARFPNYVFAYINSDKKLVIQSPSTGRTSRVQVYSDNTPGLMNSLLGLLPTVNIPETETGIVFNANSNYDATTSTLQVLVNTSDFAQNYSFTPTISTTWPDTSSKLGPIVSFVLLDDFNKRFIPQVGTDLVIILKDNILGTTITRDKLTFSGLINSTINPGIVEDQYLVSNLNFYANFDYTTSTVSFRLKDNDGDGLIPLDIKTSAGSKEVVVEIPSVSLIYKNVNIESENGLFASTTVSTIDSTTKTITIGSNPSVTKINEIIKVKPKFFGYAKGGTNVFQLTPPLAYIPKGALLNTTISGVFPLGTKIENYLPESKMIVLNNQATATHANAVANISYNYPILNMEIGSNILTTNRTIDVFKVGTVVSSSYGNYGPITSINQTDKKIITTAANAGITQKNVLMTFTIPAFVASVSMGSATITVPSPTDQEKVFVGQKITSAQFPVGTVILSKNLGVITASAPALSNGTILNLEYNAVFDLNYNPNNNNDNKTFSLSPSTNFFEGLKIEGNGIPADTYVTQVNETTIEINGTPTLSNTNVSCICRAYVNIDTNANSNMAEANPGKYLTEGMYTQDTNYDLDTNIVTLSNNILTLSGDAYTDFVYKEIEFIKNFRGNLVKNSNTIYFNPILNLKKDMEIVSDTAFPGSTKIVEVRSNGTLLVADSAAASVQEEAEASEYYDYSTFSEVFYTNGSITADISFEAKTYKYIAVDYNPNPYRNEGEAAGFLDLLKDEGKKMIGIEPLLKKVKFVPVSVSVLIAVKPGYSKTKVLEQTKTLIYENFGYLNTNYYTGIGLGFATDKLRSILNNETTNPGVEVAYVNYPTSKISDPTEVSYHFVLPESTYKTFLDLEASYPQIAGMSSLYKVDVQVE